jgi:hypothetical protein
VTALAAKVASVARGSSARWTARPTATQIGAARVGTTGRTDYGITGWLA